MEEHFFTTRTLKVLGFGLLAFAITILAGGIWSALLVTTIITGCNARLDGKRQDLVGWLPILQPV